MMLLASLLCLRDETPALVKVYASRAARVVAVVESNGLFKNVGVLMMKLVMSDREVVSAVTIYSPSGLRGGLFPLSADAPAEARQQMLNGPHVVGRSCRLEVSLQLFEARR